MKIPPSLALAAGLLAAAAAPAQGDTGLAGLVNAYRAAPGRCLGRQAAPAPPLAPDPVLAGLRLAPGILLDVALERAGYAAAEAKVIDVSGPADAAAVMGLLETRYCSVLLGSRFSAIGARRDGDTWQVVLARPAPPPAATLLPPWQATGLDILAATNAARAEARHCGPAYFPPAAPLAWNDALGQAAHEHSLDMAQRRYFRHDDPHGGTVAERAHQAGYAWRLVGENIAVGQASAQAVVADWLTSPGHCANLMNPRFTDMGAAHASADLSRSARIYWTQTFGATR